MTLESVQNYMGAKLGVVLKPREVVRLLLGIFGLVFAAAVVVDLIVQPEAGLVRLVTHGASVGLTFALAAVIGIVALLLLKSAASDLRVWHLWGVSIAAFVGGFFFVPAGQTIDAVLGVDPLRHPEPLSFGQLLPIWLVTTYVFVQPYLNDSLRSELSRLRSLNALLAKRDPDPGKRHGKAIVFQSGRTRFELPAGAIRNIVVEDHYCYVHFFEDGAYRKRDVAVPLRDLVKLLPPEFVRVHRSHVVNTNRVRSIRRQGRSLRVLLDGDYEVPVSRHRLDEVLPKLHERAGPARVAPR